jgi:multidrug efflux pump subunit AcrA (membrane-fusion protein)
MNPRLRRWLIIIGIAMGLVGSGVAAVKYRSHKAQQKELDKRKTAIKRTDVRKELVITGKVLPSSSVAVYSPASGQIKQLLVKEGDSVTEGQVLFAVSQDTSGQRELELAESEVAKARLEHRVASEALERRQDVKDLFSDIENQRAQDDFERKRLELNAAEQKLSLLRETLGLDTAKARLAGRPSTQNDRNSARPNQPQSGQIIFVKAPKSGVVTYIAKSLGESVLASNENADLNGREVIILADLDKMIVRSRILESDLAQVKVGMETDVRLDAYRDRKYIGEVSRISLQGIDDRTAGYTYFVTDIVFKNPDSFVRSQMNATVNLLVAERKNVLVLPANAVASMNGNAVVELPGDSPKSPRYRKITTGLATENLVEVTDSSFAEGDEVLEIDFAKLDLKALSEGKLGIDDKPAKN